jgi:hypothetical protein
MQTRRAEYGDMSRFWTHTEKIHASVGRTPFGEKVPKGMSTLAVGKQRKGEQKRRSAAGAGESHDGT